MSRDHKLKRIRAKQDRAKKSSELGFAEGGIITMSFDAFVRIEGIYGESSDKKHQNWIEISNYSMGLDQKISKTASSSGGATAERVGFKEFAFSKLLDKSTPLLALACADGTHIDNITVEVCRAGKDKVKFMEYKMTNCFISSFQTNCTQYFPYDKLTINYGKIEWNYAQQNRSGGGVMGNIAGGWDLEKNKKV